MLILSFLACLGYADGNGVLPEAFPFKDGFLGGDAIYSIQVGAERYVWLYGDTFWNSEKGNMTRTFNPEEFPSNTVGVTQFHESKAEFSYFRGDGERPYGIFNHAPMSMTGLTWKQREKLRIWPKDGQLVDGKLWVGLVLIVESDNMFDTLGVDYALIENPYASPDQWKVNYIETLRSGSVFPATAMTEQDGYLYSLTTIIRSLEDNQQNQTFVLLRYSSKNFDVRTSVAEYYSVDSQWRALTIDAKSLGIVDEQVIMDDMKVIAQPGNTEASLHLDEQSSKWIIIASRGLFDKATISMMVADTPTGPWSEPVDLISGYPESIPDNKEYIEGVFCYAGKGHPQLSSQFYKDSMVITYACNSFSFDQLLTDNNVYVPKAIVIDNFQSKIASAAGLSAQGR